jgi:hypothetical protein
MAIASTHELISFYTVPSNTADVTLSSIPQTYTDLYMVVVGKSSYTNDSGNGFRIQCNGVSSAGAYSWIDMRAQTTTPDGNENASDTYMQFIYLPSSGGGTPADYWGCAVVEFSAYTQTTNFKSATARSFSSLTGTGLSQGVYRQTTAISSIRWFGDGNILANSTIALYGIKGA